ncbi:uncharacterized protein LOC144099532 [Amblyomma americanum]
MYELFASLICPADALIGHGAASPKFDAFRHAPVLGGLQPQRRSQRPPEAFARVLRLPRPTRRGHDDYLGSCIGRLLELLLRPLGLQSSRPRGHQMRTSTALRASLMTSWASPSAALVGSRRRLLSMMASMSRFHGSILSTPRSCSCVGFCLPW